MSLLQVNETKTSESSDKEAIQSISKSDTLESDSPTKSSFDEPLVKLSNELSSINKPSENLSDDALVIADQEEIHSVSIVVTICAAFPLEDSKEVISDSSNKPRATEGPKPQNFYKFEYHLMPDDTEPIQTDLVTYKSAAKLFPEKSEPRIIKSWECENKVWVIWSQTHDVKLTKSRLLKLFDHELVLKIWDSRDFCSARTKFDKPKPFKFSKTGDQVEENVKRMVLDNCDIFLKQIPKPLQSRLERKLPNQRHIESPELANNAETTERLTNTLVAVPVKSATTSSKNNMNKLTELALDMDMVKSVKHLRNSEKKRPRSKTLGNKNSNLESSRKSNRHQSKLREKTKKELAAEQEFVKKNGVARIKLKMKILFSGESYLGARLVDPITTVDDCIISINLENSLMSEEQLYQLNPLTIKIEKVTNMPDKPIPMSDLKEHCLPVYCSYNFFQNPEYRSHSLMQEKHLFFYDVNVFLVGLMNSQELHEFLHSTPFEIEVHDRDRKPVTKETLKACLFGNDVNDENIGNTSLAAVKRTVHNPFDSKLKNWDPFGVARLNLYDLVIGERLLEFFVPVLPCTAPDLLGRNMNKSSQSSRKIDTENAPLQPGSFLDFNTHLNVKITTAKSVFNQRALKSSMEFSDSSDPACAFGRIVLRLDSTKKNVVITLLDLIKRINAEALGLHKYSLQVQEAAMSTHKLTHDQQTSKTFNIVTGFHLISGSNHLFVLEGIKDNGIKRILDLVVPTKNDTSIEAIFNSDIAHSKRLYADLDIDITTIKLFEPLEDIVKKPLLYIRDMTPKCSFDALVKINQLMTEFRLRSIIRCDLLPTCEMVQSMSKEFGVPFGQMDEEMFKSGSSLSAKQQDLVSEVNMINDNEEYGYEKVKTIPHTSRVWTPLDNSNAQYMQNKLERESYVKNFIQNNMENIQEASEHNKFLKPVKNYIVADNFSYSSSTKNSTEIALNKFRDYVAQTDPKQLYSYNPDSEYSSTFVPVNLKRLENEEKQKKIDQWRSAEGWIFPDVKTTLQSNQHPRRPDQPTIESLNEPWEENAFNTYKLKSPLERIFYKGHLRNKDFDLWAKPKPDNSLPVTIFEAGAVKQNLEKENSIADQSKWKAKLVVDTPTMRFRRLNASTEGKIEGAGATNQLDKLQGILKSEPVKRSLLLGGTTFNKIPALSVIKTSYHDQENFCDPSKGFTAGNSMDLRITADANKIPVFNYQHAKYDRLKGKDFNLLKQPHSTLYKRKSESFKAARSLSATRDQASEQRAVYIIPNQPNMDYVDRLNQKHNWQLASFT